MGEPSGPGSRASTEPAPQSPPSASIPLAADRLAEPWKSRRAALCAEIARDRNHVWDAFDQGRLAFIEGAPVEKNPHFHPALGYHVNVTQWELGWRREREFFLAGE